MAIKKIEPISVRPANEDDFKSIVDYFLNADKDFLLSMGADASKMPAREDWLKLLAEDHHQPLENKKFFYVIWLLEGVPVRHSNINKIIFGEEAYMHLHLWKADKRQKGIGTGLLKMSLPIFFTTFKLKRLYCEPSASNLAPNKTLKKIGFSFVKQYDTIPGWINFHQTVNTWCLIADHDL